MRTKLVIGNWKMNGSRSSNAARLADLRRSVGDGVRVAICAPHPYLSQCAALLEGSHIELGAQDVSAHQGGAYTGEVSATMLLDMGCRYVLVGHSERRTYHGETDILVAEKALRALEAGLRPIVCVGETLEEREQGLTHDVLERQVSAVTSLLPRAKLADIVLAYEPVWAIGTGRTATPEMAQEAHAVIRALLSGVDGTVADAVSILYGGSMKADNAAALLVMPDIDGGLVGGASLNPADFVPITRAAAVELC
jgi:triosephosphate isomerase